MKKLSRDDELGEDTTMLANPALRGLSSASLSNSTTASTQRSPLSSAFAPARSVRDQGRQSIRRVMTPQAGHALEILGHAIEYLTDEFVFEFYGQNSANQQILADDRIQSVQLLMALNRQIYYECPVAPAFKDRCRSFAHSIFGRPRSEHSSLA